MPPKDDPDIIARLNALYNQYANERALRTLKMTSTRLVYGSGPLDGTPKLIFVGEAPGRQEDKEGKPFVGRSGKFLDELLDTLWVARSEVYITNIVKFRPMGNRDPEPDEIEASLPYLRREIAIVAGDCRLIVGLGRIACGAISTQGIPIGVTHGTAVPLQNGFKLFCSYHPSWAIRSSANRLIMFRDFEKLRMIMDAIT